jgi:hypothetical protein
LILRKAILYPLKTYLLESDGPREGEVPRDVEWVGARFVPKTEIGLNI